MTTFFYQFPSEEAIFCHLERDPQVILALKDRGITHMASHILSDKFLHEQVIKKEVSELVIKNFTGFPVKVAEGYSQNLYKTLIECSTCKLELRSKL